MTAFNCNSICGKIHPKKFEFEILSSKFWHKLGLVKEGPVKDGQKSTVDNQIDHGRLYRWTENSFPFFLYLKPVEISKKMF